MVVVAVGLGIVGGGLGMVDAHTDVTDGHRAYLSRFEMEEGRARGVGGRRDGTDDAAARGPPLVAHLDGDTIEAQLRHLQEPPERQRVELCRSIGTDAGTVARETVGKGAILGENHDSLVDSSVIEGDAAFRSVVHIFSKKDIEETLPKGQQREECVTDAGGRVSRHPSFITYRLVLHSKLLDYIVNSNHFFLKIS